MNYDAIVDKGATLLDERYPDTWYDKIDLDTLDLSTTDHCVLGQLYNGSYYVGRRTLGLTRGGAAELGFDGLEELTDAWRRLIIERKNANVRARFATTKETPTMSNDRPDFILGANTSKIIIGYPNGDQVHVHLDGTVERHAVVTTTVVTRLDVIDDYQLS
jgi:hypothetical protein